MGIKQEPMDFKPNPNWNFSFGVPDFQARGESRPRPHFSRLPSDVVPDGDTISHPPTSRPKSPPGKPTKSPTGNSENPKEAKKSPQANASDPTSSHQDQDSDSAFTNRSTSLGGSAGGKTGDPNRLDSYYDSGFQMSVLEEPSEEQTEEEKEDVEETEKGDIEQSEKQEKREQEEEEVLVVQEEEDGRDAHIQSQLQQYRRECKCKCFYVHKL